MLWLNLSALGFWNTCRQPINQRECDHWAGRAIKQGMSRSGQPSHQSTCPSKRSSTNRPTAQPPNRPSSQHSTQGLLIMTPPTHPPTPPTHPTDHAEPASQSVPHAASRQATNGLFGHSVGHAVDQSVTDLLTDLLTDRLTHQLTHPMRPADARTEPNHHATNKSTKQPPMPTHRVPTFTYYPIHPLMYPLAGQSSRPPNLCTLQGANL